MNSSVLASTTSRNASGNRYISHLVFLALMSSARTTRRNATIHDKPRFRTTFPRSRSIATLTRSTFPRSRSVPKRIRSVFARTHSALPQTRPTTTRTRSTIPRSRITSAHPYLPTLAPRQRARDAHVTQSRAHRSVKKEARAGPGRRRIHHETRQRPGVEQEKETQRQKHQEPQRSDAADSKEALAAHG